MTANVLVEKILEGHSIRQVIESASGVHVVDVHCEDTGGHVFTYYGKLSNGQYFVLGLGAVMLCDADYGETLTEEFYDQTGGDTYEWEQDHKIAEFSDASKVSNKYKDLVKTIIVESFEKLGKEIDSDFVAYVK